MEDSGRINVTMTMGEYELFKEAKKRATFEKKQTTASRPGKLPEVSRNRLTPLIEVPRENNPWNFLLPFIESPARVITSRILVATTTRSNRKFLWQKVLCPRTRRRERLLSSEKNVVKDPEYHLRKFRNAVLLHQYSDVIKCRVFLNTLSGSAKKWFDRLPHGSITCFSDFKIAFLRHFASSRKYQKMDHYLFVLKQGPSEPLRSYIKRFNQVAQDAPSATSEILMSAFSHGLTEGEFFRDLIRNPVKNFDEMLEKVTSYINVEEAQAARRKTYKPPPVNKIERRVPQPPAQPLPRAREARPTFHPGQDVRSGLRVATVHARRPGPWGPRYCTYHRSHMHATSDCYQFARDSHRSAELSLPPPELAPQIREDLECNNKGVPGSQEKPERRKSGQHRHSRHRHNLRRTYRRSSGRARKSHERRLEIHAVGCSREQAAGPVISFGPQDLEGLELPHDDTLIIKVVIANSRVARVFIDTGSSVNVLFRFAFDEMQIDASELQPVATSLYGFTDNEVKPMGQIKLAISLGSEPLVRTKRRTFIVVDSPSSYNVILGRPTLHEFRVAVSTFHQKIKFPMGEWVREVRGEQQVSRRCYIDMVKVEARKAQRT
ncbi:uncharacterized protein LOC121994698 [Zingiber officinale]|uniref:uncharacterized protein LOC121994698 n=1 Tax=Zingiber officinale TaxID=94328 RepID=UPI001C4BF752|nr:uncharacterized protein LOC121994698 [Zingiber officinale]